MKFLLENEWILGVLLILKHQIDGMFFLAQSLFYTTAGWISSSMHCTRWVISTCPHAASHMLYSYLAHLRLQLHMQYQPRSDMFACSLTSTHTTITTPSMVKPATSHHHQPPPTTINSHKHQQQTAWPQECHVTCGFGCWQLSTCVEGPWAPQDDVN